MRAGAWQLPRYMRDLLTSRRNEGTAARPDQSRPGPVGALSRRNLVRETTEILLAAEGTEQRPEETLRVNGVVREMPDGYWGSYGTTVRMEDMVAIVDPTHFDESALTPERTKK